MNRQPLSATLAANLNYLMKQQGLTQTVVARRAGISQKSVSNILNATCSASIENVQRLADAFKLPAWALLLDYSDQSLLRDALLPEAIQILAHCDPDARAHLLENARFEERRSRLLQLPPPPPVAAYQRLPS